MNSIIEAQETFLEYCPFKPYHFRMINYRRYPGGPIDIERNKAEDELNAIMNKQWEVKLLDDQRKI